MFFYGLRENVSMGDVRSTKTLKMGKSLGVINMGGVVGGCAWGGVGGGAALFTTLLLGTWSAENQDHKS